MDMMQRKQQHLKFLKWIYLPKRVKEKKVKSLSRVQLFATPWTVAYQAPPSLGFSRQEYWSGLPFPSPRDFPNPGIEHGSPALQADTLLSEPPGKPSSFFSFFFPCFTHHFYRSTCLSKFLRMAYGKYFWEDDFGLLLAKYVWRKKEN